MVVEGVQDRVVTTFQGTLNAGQLIVCRTQVTKAEARTQQHSSLSTQLHSYGSISC